MKYNKLGTTNLDISLIGLGTMTFGEQTSKDEAFKIMDYAFDKGINFFDTAEMYPVYPRKETQGLSEVIIGEWINSRKIREKIIIGTKISSSHPKGIGYTKLSWIRNGGNNLKFDKKNFNEAINSSLKRLNTDYVDLYQLHWPERNIPIFGNLDYEHDYDEKAWTPIEEVLNHLNDLIKTGKIRNFGVSNESPWGIMNFINISKNKNLKPPASIQNVYNLINRVFDISHSEISMREKCGLLAYSPLASGRLTGKYLFGKKPKNSRFLLWPGRFDRHFTKKGEEAIKKYIKLADEYSIEPHILAHAFVLSRPFLTSSIAGVASLDQLKANLFAVDVKLSSEIIKKINNIHHDERNPCV